MASGLVGREVELAAIGEALDGAAAGRASRMILVGEAGIGKTSLLRVAAAGAAARGLRTLEGTAIESGTGIPFLPLLAPLAATDDRHDGDAPALAVRRLVRGTPAGTADADHGHRTLRTLTAGQPAADAGSAARLVESIFEVLARRPTALILDDVHWADASTLTVLDHLGHRARDVGLAVILAARDDEPGWLERLAFADGRRYALVHVPRLDPAQVAGQIEALTGTPPGRALADRLARRSAGNPFMVEQLLAAEASSPRRDGALPMSLRLLVERRLARLPGGVREVLDALAVIGRPTDRATLAAVAAADDAAVGAALESAVAAGIAVAGAVVDVRHPVYREALLEQLDRARAATLHGRAAVAVAAGGASASEVATHWWRSEDRRAAWASAMEAGDEAQAELAFGEVRVHLEHAVDAWPPGEPGLREAALRASQAAWITGDAAGALDVVRRVIGRLQPDVALLTAQAGYEWDAGERVASAATFERIAALPEGQVAPAERPRVLWGLGRARVAAGRPDAAAALARQAAAAAAEVGDVQAEAEAEMLFAMSRAFEDSFEGIPSLERAHALAMRSGSPVTIGQCDQFLVDLLESSGQLDRALAVAVEAIDECDRLGVAGSHGSDLRGRAALMLIDLGRWDEAAAILEPADPRAFPSLARALLAVRSGDEPAATGAFEAARAGGAIGGPGSLGGWLEIGLAEAAWTAGDAAGASAAIDAIPAVPGVWARNVVARAAWWRSRVRPDPSAVAARRADARRATDAALAAALCADIAAAGLGTGPAWAAAADAWAAARRPYEAACARLREAGARFAAGERDAGRAALHAVTEVAAGLGADPLARWALDLGRRARVQARTTRRSAPDPGELTPRERDVLALLAEGLTNPAIATRLYLSPKTVGIHVTRILEKLGAHTRGEAVAVARRRGLLA